MGTVTSMELARKKRTCKKMTLRWTAQPTGRHHEEMFELVVLEGNTEQQNCSRLRVGPSLSYLTVAQPEDAPVCGLIVRRALDHLTSTITPVRTLGDLVRVAFCDDLARVGSYTKEQGLRARLTELDLWRELFDTRDIPAEMRVALATRSKSELCV